MPINARIYLDTSELNFLYVNDVPDLRKITEELFNTYIKTGIYNAYISDVVVQEINNTTNEIRRRQLLFVIEDFHQKQADLSAITEVRNLADLYIYHKIIPVNKRADALHIAISVVNHFDYLVSWNYKHLANVNRERRVLAVNYENNYLHPLRIVTPLELFGYEN